MGRQRKIATGFGERLFSVINEEHDIDSFAEKLKTPISTINNYLRGDREPSYNFFLRLKQKTNVDLNWLITGEQKVDAPSVLLSSPKKPLSIPHYEISQNTGEFGIKKANDSGEYAYINHDWLPKNLDSNAKLGTVIADGDSMNPTFKSGDLLLVNLDTSPTKLSSGGIYLADFQGNFFIRRLQKMGDGSVEIIADNERYKSERMPAAKASSELKLHGEVVWVCSHL